MRNFHHPTFVLLVGIALTTVVVTRLFAQVNQEWVGQYDGTGQGRDIAYSLAINSTGNIYVTGYSENMDNTDYVTIKYDASGNQLWVARYNGPGNGDDEANSLAVDREGNVYVTGSCAVGGTNRDYATIKYNSMGDRLWVRFYDGPGHGDDCATFVAVDQVGNAYVTGYSTGDRTDYDYATIRYNSAGTQQWVTRYNGSGNGADQAFSAAVDGDGQVIVTGYSLGSETGLDYATVKYDSTGNQQWIATYNGPGNDLDEARSVAVDVNGYIYVAGYSYGYQTDFDYATIKYNPNGTLQWVARYNNPDNGEDYTDSFTIDETGNVYVTGCSHANITNCDYATVKYSTDGIQQWVARYNGPGNNIDGARAIAVDRNGNVYVSGKSIGNGTNYDYATLKYDSFGNQLWIVRYNGSVSGDDRAYSTAVDRAGNVYVTGYSTESGSDYDYATIKYNQNSILSIETTPISPPITIPANGGSFQYNIIVHNLVTTPQTFQIWNKVRNSIGQYTPVFGPISRSLPGGANPTCVLAQAIAGSISSGTLCFISYIGTYPSRVQDSSFFTITKSTVADGGPWIGESSVSGDIFDEYAITTTEIIPEDYTLEQNYPNPFNPMTMLKLGLPQAGNVNLAVYNMMGQKVATLVDGWRHGGYHHIAWDASGLAAGIYFCRVRVGDFTATKKLVVMK
ncbi:MAG: SBBP repeat-containing protein [bacterium]|nr:SBBP repeat-containing protein [bacterium]